MTAYTDFHYSPTGSGVISGSQVLEQTEQGINGLGQYVQDNISGAIDTANQALTIAQTANTNATTALNTANSFSDAITTANQTANNALTTAQSAQSTANAASSLATTANNNATSALNAANAATSNVNTLTSTVNGLGNRMTAAENAISANAGNITTLQNNLATTNANVTAAANAASTAQATATSAQATATSAKNAAYVLRYTGTTITGGGTIAYADIDNTDNIKAGDKIIDISGAIYAIASVDIANETVTVGASPVINLFCDAENLIPAANNSYDLGSSAYQWKSVYAGKTYTGLIKAATGDLIIQSNGTDKSVAIYNGTLVGDGGGIWLYGKDHANGSKVRLQIYNTTTSGFEGVDLSNSSLYPAPNNLLNLGTSTNKWKTLNGVNPGALSLPGEYISSITEYITDKTGGNNTYTAPADGWVGIQASSATLDSTNFVFMGRTSDGTNYFAQNASSPITSYWSNLYHGCILLPVIGGKTYGIRCKCDSVDARFYKANGNVS